MSADSMVTQALADRLEAIWRNKPPEMPTMIHEKEREVILSALRHNTAAQPEREAVLEEAALKAASQRHKRVSGIADCETLLDAYWNGCLDAAEAIRALLGEGE